MDNKHTERQDYVKRQTAMRRFQAAFEEACTHFLTPEDLLYLEQLKELAECTIEHDSKDVYSFEIDDLAGLHEIAEGDEGIWVRGWIFVHNDKLEAAGLREPEEDGETQTDDDGEQAGPPAAADGDD